MRKVSPSTVGRLSIYLRVLSELDGLGAETVSSEELASRCGSHRDAWRTAWKNPVIGCLALAFSFGSVRQFSSRTFGSQS